MDIVAIHTALVEIWPDGIPREAYPALVGIFKVCGDLEVAALREKVQDEAIAEGDLAKFMNAIPFTHHPNGRKIKREAKVEAPAADQLVDGILQAYASNEGLDVKPPPRGSQSQMPRSTKSGLFANNYGGPPRKLKDVVQPPARPTTPKIVASRQRRTFVSEATIALVSRVLGEWGSLRKEDIARQTKRGPRAVRYALAALQARGLVKRIERRGGQPHLFGLA